MVDSGILAKHFTRTLFAKTHDFTRVCVDRDVGFPCGDEKHLVGGIEIVNNRLSLLITPPGTAQTDARQTIR